MKDSIEIRQGIIDACLWLKEKGLVFGTWGNISVRVEEGILITPSKVAYEEMTPEDLVLLSKDGEVIKGHRLSTSERELHLRIMKKRDDVGAIIHMHSPFAMAAAARDSGVPVISEEMCQLLGGAIPLSDHFVPSQEHVALGEVVADSITDANAILIRNHGPMCFARNLEEAKVCCQVVEKSCQIYLQLLAAGGFCEVPEKWVEEGRNYFLYSYGKS